MEVSLCPIVTLGDHPLKRRARTHYIGREHAMTTDAQTRVLFVEDKPELQRAYGRYFGSRYDVVFAEELAHLIDDAA